MERSVFVATIIEHSHTVTPENGLHKKSISQIASIGMSTELSFVYLSRFKLQCRTLDSHC